MTITLTNNLSNPVYNFDITMPKAPENVRGTCIPSFDQEQRTSSSYRLWHSNAFTNTGGEGENQNGGHRRSADLPQVCSHRSFSNIIQRFVSGVDIKPI